MKLTIVITGAGGRTPRFRVVPQRPAPAGQVPKLRLVISNPAPKKPTPPAASLRPAA